MQLYLRHELATSQHGMVARKTKTRFIIYARLTLNDEERRLVNTFDMHDAVLVVTPGDVVRGEPKELPHDVQELVNGTELACPSFAAMLSVEERLRSGCENLKDMIAAARALSAQHETIINFE